MGVVRAKKSIMDNPWKPCISLFGWLSIPWSGGEIVIAQVKARKLEGTLKPVYTCRESSLKLFKQPFGSIRNSMSFRFWTCHRDVLYFFRCFKFASSSGSSFSSVEGLLEVPRRIGPLGSCSWRSRLLGQCPHHMRCRSPCGSELGWKPFHGFSGALENLTCRVCRVPFFFRGQVLQVRQTRTDRG